MANFSFVSVSADGFIKIYAGIMLTKFQFSVYFYYFGGLEFLTYWGPDKMAAIFADNILKCILLNENCILIKISLKYVCKGTIDYNPSLVQIMAWHRTGDKPSSEQMMASFGDASTCLLASMS